METRSPYPWGLKKTDSEQIRQNMALKKSELYSSLWASCDELRGGMDASQYKDYVLVMLFVKYIRDKYVGVPYAPIILLTSYSIRFSLPMIYHFDQLTLIWWL
jgi:hypothetical protein